MGWEQDGLGWGAMLPGVSPQSTRMLDRAECGGRGGAEKIVWCSNWKEKYVQG